MLGLILGGIMATAGVAFGVNQMNESEEKDRQLQSQRQNLNEEICRLEEEKNQIIAQQEAERKEHQKINAELEKKVDHLESENKGLTKKNDLLSEENERLKVANEQLQLKTKHLQKQTEEIENQNERLREQNKLYDQRFKRLEEHYQKVEQMLADKNRQLMEKDEELSNMKIQMKQQEQNIRQKVREETLKVLEQITSMEDLEQIKQQIKANSGDTGEINANSLQFTEQNKQNSVEKFMEKNNPNQTQAEKAASETANATILEFFQKKLAEKQQFI